MDEFKTFSDIPDDDFPVARPYLPPRPVSNRPCDFTALQLVMVPSGKTFELTKPDQVLGRHSSADVRLPLADVSRRHCRIVFANGGWNVIDLDSLNGIFVNNQRVGQSRLRSGDVLRVGSFLFEVRVVETTGIYTPRRAS